MCYAAFVIVCFSAPMPSVSAETKSIVNEQERFRSKKELQQCFDDHPGLTHLYVKEFFGRELPVLPPTLKDFSVSYSTAETIRELPNGLTDLWLNDLPKLRTLPKIPSTVKMAYFRWLNCKRLDVITSGTLKTLDIVNCPKVEVVNLPPSVQRITIKNCPKLTSIVFPESTRFVAIENCGVLSNLVFPESTRDITIENCRALSNLLIPNKLSSLGLDSCGDIQLPSLPPTLNSLSLSNWQNLETLPLLPDSLEYLTLDRCPNLKALPALPKIMKTLGISCCPNLEDFSELPRGLHSLFLYGCPNVRSLPPELERWSTMGRPSDAFPAPWDDLEKMMVRPRDKCCAARSNKHDKF